MRTGASNTQVVPPVSRWGGLEDSVRGRAKALPFLVGWPRPDLIVADHRPHTEETGESPWTWSTDGSAARV